MEQILSRFLSLDNDCTSVLALLVDELRPADARDTESARRNLQALCYILSTHPDLR